MSLSDKATAQLFSALSFNDEDGDGGTITITYAGANGTLSGTGLTGTAGNYTLSGANPTELTSRLQALVFTPTENQVAPISTVQTTFALTPHDGTVSGTTVTATATVTSVNDAPTDITLSSISVNQSGGVNAVVGTLATTDPDVGDTHVYNLVSGAGDTDNARFNIFGSTLRANDASAMAPGSYSVRVRTTDAGGLSFNNAFPITVVDDIPPVLDDAPAVSNITLTGFTLSASINESGTIYYVVVANGAAAPSSAQVIAGLNASGVAALASGSRAVAEAPFTSSFDITGLNQGTAYSIYVVARDSANNTMSPPVRVDTTTLANAVPVITLPASPSVHEDSATNAITGITIADQDGDSQTVTLTAVENGVVSVASHGTVSGNGSFLVTISGSLAEVNDALAGLTFTPTANFHGTATIQVQTNDGNGGVAGKPLNITVNQGPTVTSIIRVGDPRTNADILQFDVAFSRAVNGVDAADFQVTGGTTATVSNITTTDNTTYRVTVSGGDLTTFDGTVGLNVVDNDSIVRQDTGTPLGGVGTSGAGDGSFAAGEAYIVDNTPPTVLAGAIAITGHTGTGGAFRVGDTVVVEWNPAGNDDIASVSVDFSQFGGGSAVAASLIGGVWRATYIITAGTIDATGRTVGVTATDMAGNTSDPVASDTLVTVDNQPPVVNVAAITLSGATGTGGAVKVGDTVTVTWDQVGNSDIVGVTIDFSHFGGETDVVASLVGGLWTATYTIPVGVIDATGRTIGVTATDDAGNVTTTTAGNATVDNQPPIVSPAYISVTGATGNGGAFKIGDTVTVTWNNTGGGDNNVDIAGVVVDFSSIGGEAAVTATHNGTGTWTATHVITAGSLDGVAGLTITLQVTDDAGNTTSAASATTLMVDNVPPGPATGTLVVDEMAPNGTVVGVVSSSGALAYQLSDNAGGRFLIDTAMGMVTVANGSLLDFETQNTHNITVRVFDSAGNTTDTVLEITLRDVNDPPILDLNGAEADTSYSTTFNVCGPPVAIAAADAVLHDVDAGAQIASLTVVIAAAPNGAAESLEFSSQAQMALTGAGLTASYNAVTSTLSISGAADPAIYQTILRGILYNNSSEPGSANLTNRTLTVTVSDGTATTDATSTINVMVAPVVTVPGGPVTFTEDAGAVLIAAEATITDLDSTDLSQVSITLTNPLDGAAESISLAGRANGDVVNGITITYSSATSITLTGLAALGYYQDVVRSLQYLNISHGPETVTQRVITIVARDSDGNTGPAASARVNVESVNDAPMLTVLAPSLGMTDENTPAVRIVSSFLGPVTDPDRDPLFGIAIIGSSGNGTWQHSIDGGATWVTPVETISNNNALLLRDTDWVRYVPDGQNGEAASLTYRAWDRTCLNAAGSHADTTTNGGATAFSTNTATGMLTVTDVNDAPTLTDGASFYLAGTDENTTSSATLVSAILTGVGYADVDHGAMSGIAITGSSARGVWRYTLNGTDWLDLDSVTTTSALLLRSTSQVRYVPDGQWGETATLTFRAWDQTSGISGHSADVTTSGGTTAFSTASASARITVTDVNDAPVLSVLAVSLPRTDIGTALVAMVDSFLDSTDVDLNALRGIAVVDIAGAGEWQYSTNDGTTWESLAGVRHWDARLLRGTDLVRYTPDGTTAEIANMSFRAWDQTSGTAGGTADTFANGGTTAFSSGTGIAIINVAFAVAYDANGSTGGTVPTVDVYDSGATVTVMGNIGTLLRAGYTFTGWNSQADDQGQNYAPGDTFTIGTANVTLYAVWTANKYTISFDSAGGSTVDSMEQDFGTVVTAPANPTRTGYSFTGWSPALPPTMPAVNITVVAQWTPHVNPGEFVPSPPPPPPAPPEPTPEPEKPHTVTTISPQGVITEIRLESVKEVREDGRTQENITIPAQLVKTILADKAAASDTLDINISTPGVPAEGDDPTQTTAQPVISVTVPPEVLGAAKDMTLSLTTPHGTLTLPPQLVNTLASQQQNLTVIIDRQPIQEVRDLLPAGTEPIGAALSVQTDLKGPTKVTIPINSNLSESEDLRQAFLDQLMTFAIHSSGSREMIYEVAHEILETPYIDEQGVERIRYTLKSVSFWVNEFSRFVAVKPNWGHLETIVGTPGFTIAGVSRDMVACYYKGNDTYMPIRMLEDFGVNFAWDEASQTATMNYKGRTVVLTIGSTDAYIKGMRTPIVGASGARMAPELALGRTMIPLRFVSEHLGFAVTWDPSNLVTVKLNESR